MSCISSWDKLEDIKEGVKLLEGVIKHDSKAVVVVDSDLDGYSSAAILFNYLYSIYPEWTKNNLSYLLHDGKQHGLEDMIDNIPNRTELILCPDSSSNDYNCHEQLVGKADILILDHHLADHKSTSINTITVNNQLCDYPNKEFSGAGIV
jgi:single-stranded-DNA-specific exonuclease